MRTRRRRVRRPRLLAAGPARSRCCGGAAAAPGSPHLLRARRAAPRREAPLESAAGAPPAGAHASTPAAAFGRRRPAPPLRPTSPREREAAACDGEGGARPGPARSRSRGERLRVRLPRAGLDGASDVPPLLPSPIRPTTGGAATTRGSGCTDARGRVRAACGDLPVSATTATSGRAGAWTALQRTKNDALWAARVARRWPPPARCRCPRCALLGRALGRAAHLLAPDARAHGAARTSRASSRSWTTGRETRSCGAASSTLGELLGETVAMLRPGARPFRRCRSRRRRARSWPTPAREGRGVVFASAHLGPVGARRRLARRGGRAAGRAGPRELRPALLAPLRAPARRPRRARRLAGEARAPPRASCARCATGRSSACPWICARASRRATRRSSVTRPPTPVGPARIALRARAPVVVGTAAPGPRQGLVVTATRIASGDLPRDDDGRARCSRPASTPSCPAASSPCPTPGSGCTTDGAPEPGYDACPEASRCPTRAYARRSRSPSVATRGTSRCRRPTAPCSRAWTVSRPRRTSLTTTGLARRPSARVARPARGPRPRHVRPGDRRRLRARPERWPPRPSACLVHAAARRLHRRGAAHARGGGRCSRRTSTSTSEIAAERARSCTEASSTLDHYALLGVARSADRKALKRAYFDLAARFHPDKYFRKKLGSYKLRWRPSSGGSRSRTTR